MQSIRSSLSSLSCHRGQMVAPGIRWLSKKIGGNDPQDLFKAELRRLTSHQKSLSQSVITLNNLFKAMPAQSHSEALLKTSSANTAGWEISLLEGKAPAVASLKFTAPRDGLEQPVAAADADSNHEGGQQVLSPVNNVQPSTASNSAPANCDLTAGPNPPSAERSREILLPEKFIHYPDGISEIRFSPSGELFLIVRRNILEIWGKGSDGQWAQQGALAHRDRILRPCFNARENAVLTWSLDGQAKILGQNSNGTWSEQGVIKFEGNNTPWIMARFSRSGDHILSDNLSIINGEIQIWGRDASGQWQAKARIHNARLDDRRQGLFTGPPVSDHHIFTKFGSLAQIWSSADDWCKPLEIHHNDTVRGTCLSANERHALTFDYTGAVKLFDFRQKWSEAGEINHGAGVAEAIFSDDGHFVLTIGDNSDKMLACKIWHRAGSWSNLASITHNVGVKFARFLANNHVLSCGMDGKVIICSHNRYGKEMVRVEHTGKITNVAISPSGKQLLTCSEDGTAKLMHFDQYGYWSEQAVIQHQGVVLGGSFSPCGNSVLTFGKDNSARLWARNDSQPWQERAVIHHKNTINGVQFSPSGDLAITFSKDGTAVVCARQTGQNWRERRVIVHGAPVRAVQINAIEEWIVTSGTEDDDKVWFCDRDVSVREMLMMPSMRQVEFGRGHLLTLAPDKKAVVWSINGSS